MSLSFNLLHLFLLGDSDSFSSSTGRAGVLTSDSESEVMSKTLVELDFLHSLKIFSHLGIPVVGDLLCIGAVLGVLSSVDHPFGDVIV